MYHPIIDLIRSELEERKITRAEFADMCGYSLSNLHNWLTGRCEPRFTAVEDMLNALGYRLVIIKKEGEDV